MLGRIVKNRLWIHSSPFSGRRKRKLSGDNSAATYLRQAAFDKDMPRREQ
jgi:hypothetical protein